MFKYSRLNALSSMRCHCCRTNASRLSSHAGDPHRHVSTWSGSASAGALHSNRRTLPGSGSSKRSRARCRYACIRSLVESPAVDIRNSCPWFFIAMVGTSESSTTSRFTFQASSTNIMEHEYPTPAESLAAWISQRSPDGNSIPAASLPHLTAFFP